MSAEVGSAIERVARDAFGRLVALLAVQTRDIAAAEDALSDALVRALEHWPHQGIPENPPAWLLTTARRCLIDQARRANHADAAQAHLTQIRAEIDDAMAHEHPFHDHRLGLMLACAHPEIDEASHTPLMLQLVLGLSAERIASAFLTSPATMTKRLVRAKAQIKADGLSFEVPEKTVLASRIEPVLQAVYGAFTLGWDEPDISQGDSSGGLSEEAIWLGSIVANLMPYEPEALGLLSLMLHSHARKAARRNRETGAYMPLDCQDILLWNRDLIAKANGLIRRAGELGTLGRFQLEAAIQSVHAARLETGRTDWAALVLLYEGLVALAPSLGAHLGRAVAIGKTSGPRDALAVLDAINSGVASGHQPYWAVKAHLHSALGETESACAAYFKAAGLSEDHAVREWLLAQRASLLS